MMRENEIVLFETEDKKVTLPVEVKDETVWLNRKQMAELFDRDVKTIGKHINNALNEELCDEKSVVANFATTATDGKIYQVEYYNLDVIISVGYRVKSNRGIEFRRWANSVLKKYILQGYAINQKRVQQLGEVIRIMKRTENELDSNQILSIIERYNSALELLDAYDHQTMNRPKGNEAIYVLNYAECIKVIQSMRFGDETDLFGREKDESFKGSIGNIYQSFDGKEVYDSLEEKAANLLYFVTKNHSFYDGNKRIAAIVWHRQNQGGINMYFLIDYENVQCAGLEGTEFLEEKDTVIIFFSACSGNIVNYRLEDILNSKCKFEICKLKKARKNALDFYIASKVGEIFALEQNAKVAIISADKDYQSVIDYWKPRLRVQNQLVRAKTIAIGISLVNGEGTRKMLVNNKTKILKLEEEYLKYQERNRIALMLGELFVNTEYEKFILQIVDIVSNSNKPRTLYLGSIKKFGKKAGTEVYRRIKDCVCV